MYGLCSRKYRKQSIIFAQLTYRRLIELGFIQPRGIPTQSAYQRLAWCICKQFATFPGYGGKEMANIEVLNNLAELAPIGEMGTIGFVAIGLYKRIIY